MGWPLETCLTTSVHGRPVDSLVPLFGPGARLIVLARDGETPAKVAQLLCDNGYGASPMTALSHMQGHREARIDAPADSWDATPDKFHTLCVTCTPDAGAGPLLRAHGLPDEAFVHDGKMTKQEVRALTLSRLSPARDELLWDIGCGCGSVSVEWMRAAPGARAIGLEPDGKRRSLAGQNASRLGTPGLVLVNATAPDGLAGLEPPDAIFIGGGLSEQTAEASLAALKPHGRLCANAVTLESEQLLTKLHRQHGGQLVRLSVARAEPVGRMTGWKPLMPVTQWSLTKGGLP
jgi:precorrin-6Y C5,15-methyltransferase (decarboxylating)